LKKRVQSEDNEVFSLCVGYVLRLCPFEDVSMVGLMPEEVTAFLQVQRVCLEIKNVFSHGIFKNKFKVWPYKKN
jgi:hypothetical protein